MQQSQDARTSFRDTPQGQALLARGDLLRWPRVISAADMPCGPHFAIIVTKIERIVIPGDERSRTSPGHGYPEETREIPDVRYYTTTDRGAWETMLARLTADPAELGNVVGIEVAGTARGATRVAVEMDRA